MTEDIAIVSNRVVGGPLLDDLRSLWSSRHVGDLFEEFCTTLLAETRVNECRSLLVEYLTESLRYDSDRAVVLNGIVIQQLNEAFPSEARDWERFHLQQPIAS